MRLNIVELLEGERGDLAPDPEKIVAIVDLEPDLEEVNMEILDPEYEEEIREIFSNPIYCFSTGITTREGISIDAGIQEIQPWQPEVLAVLPEKLSIIGLDYVLVPKS